MSLAEKIKTRGYWRVVIRPASFERERIENIADLFPLVRSSSVQLRGWDFPHIDQRTQPRIDASWVQQDIEWEHHLERWRMYQSGQFAYLKAFTVDWAKDTSDWIPRPPKPPRGSLIGIGDILYRFAEIFEFASALAMTPAGDDRIFVEVGCHGIEGRELWVDDQRRMPLYPAKIANVKEYPQRQCFDRTNLVAETSQIGLRWSLELFRRFGWDPSWDVLEEARAEFRRR